MRADDHRSNRHHRHRRRLRGLRLRACFCSGVYPARQRQRQRFTTDLCIPQFEEALVKSGINPEQRGDHRTGDA